jgi:hypothetical protein
MESWKGGFEMSLTTDKEQNERPEQREDFLITAFRHLESRLQGIRREVMKRAAETAKAACSPDAEVYEVTEEHVEKALSDLVKDPKACRRAAGFLDD